MRGARERAGIVDAAPDAREQRHAPADVLGDRVHHPLGFGGGERIEFAGIAVRHQDVHAGIDGAIHDRL